ncbi:hypothetical protein ZWY2020_030174 [Hordeum vulgare]|nr:hypothetical protein ZWY2020_030174 [Hordeum vulgare]
MVARRQSPVASVSDAVAAGPLVRRLPRRRAFTPGELRRPAAPSPPLPSLRYIPAVPAARRHTCLLASFFLASSSRRWSRRSLLPPPFSVVPAMDHAGGSSSSGGGAAESNWPQSLDKPLTQELYDFGLLVPSGCRLAKPWRICRDGYPTLDNPSTPEQLRVHPGGRYNTRGRHDY